MHQGSVEIRNLFPVKWTVTRYLLNYNFFYFGNGQLKTLLVLLSQCLD